MEWTRREILRALPTAATLPMLSRPAQAQTGTGGTVELSGHRLQRPLAITMWDFSWLERR